MKHLLLVATIAVFGLCENLSQAQWIGQAAGYNLQSGFDTTAIESPGDMRETDWSKWIATQAGLDPLTVCEVRTYCGSRVDILTCCEAIEVEWSHKWKESVGQALLYAIETGRQPAVILLSRGNDLPQLLRCQAVCARAGVRLYVQKIPDKFPVPESEILPESIGYGEVIFAKRLRIKR